MRSVPSLQFSRLANAKMPPVNLQGGLLPPPFPQLTSDHPCRISGNAFIFDIAHADRASGWEIKIALIYLVIVLVLTSQRICSRNEDIFDEFKNKTSIE